MEILALNSISPVVDDVWKKKYKLVKECKAPAAIMLRSFKMHDYALPESVLCVGRAGAGTNNIPSDKYAEKGVVVFNSPGANANAVKELVLLSLLMCGRNVIDSISWAQSLKGRGADVPSLVEKGKGDFVGGEIKGKTLGVVGLGAIGILVANAAVALGMNVIGFDPFISVKGAWNLSRKVKPETDLNTLLKNSDFVSLHAPLNAQTKGMIGKDTLKIMKDGVNIVNASRAELVDTAALKQAIKTGKVHRYVVDFPTEEILGEKNIIPIPHLGASTPEAEDNCAYMIAEQIQDFIENGNITNSVNFPTCVLPKNGKQRVTVVHKNVKGVIGALTEFIGKQGINISAFVSQSSGDYAYAILDLDTAIESKAVDQIKQLPNIVKVRVI